MSLKVTSNATHSQMFQQKWFKMEIEVEVDEMIFYSKRSFLHTNLF